MEIYLAAVGVLAALVSQAQQVGLCVQAGEALVSESAAIDALPTRAVPTRHVTALHANRNIRHSGATAT